MSLNFKHAIIVVFVALTPILEVAAQVSRPRITGISHVRIRVSDFCPAHEFYSAIMGQRSGCSAKIKPDGGSRALWSGQFITLNVHSLYGTSPSPNNLLEEIGFLTEDADALRLYLQSAGITSQNVSEDRPKSFVVRDPEGHRIQFIERALPEQESPGISSIQRSRLIHAGFVVKNRAAMDKFYKDVLEFHVYWHGGMKDGDTDWVDMQVPDGTDWIEYMLNVPDNADKHLLGIMNHIALGVPDVRAAAKELEAHGMKLPEQPQIGRDGKWQLNLYDPDDTRVELMEFTPVQKPCCSEYSGPHPKP